MGLLAGLGPFAILGFAAGHLAARWETIPARFPIHWGFDGQPNGWSTRSLGGVFGPLLLGAAICAALTAFRLLPLRSAGQRAALRVNLVAEYCIALAIGVSVWHPGEPPNFRILVFGILFPSILVALLAVRFARRAPEAGHSQPQSANPWRAGVFYVNADDPALWVPKRTGLGWTLNFARPLAWVVMAAILAVAAGIPLVAMLLR